MKKETIENAVTEIDTEYLCEAAAAAESSRKTHKKGIGKIFLIAAALMVLLAAGISAASPADLSFYLDKAFHGGYDLIDGMTALPRNVVYSASGDEIKLEMKGIIGDAQTVNVFYDITVNPESGLTGKELVFHVDMEPVWNLFHFPKSEGYGYSRKELGHEVLEDGSVVYRMCGVVKGENLKPGDDMTVTLRSVSAVDFEARKEVPLLTGKWSMVFTMDYEDVTKVIPYDREITPRFYDLSTADVTETTCPLHLREVRISPLSLMVIGDYDPETDLGGMEFAGVGVQYRDGSVVPKMSSYRMTGGMQVLCEDGTWHDATEEEIAEWESRNTISGGAGSTYPDPENPGRYIRTWIWTFSSQLDYENAVTLLLGGEAVALQ